MVVTEVILRRITIRKRTQRRTT